MRQRCCLLANIPKEMMTTIKQEEKEGRGTDTYPVPTTRFHLPACLPTSTLDKSSRGLRHDTTNHLLCLSLTHSAATAAAAAKVNTSFSLAVSTTNEF
jgi:hypothetical protein